MLKATISSPDKISYHTRARFSRKRNIIAASRVFYSCCYMRVRSIFFLPREEHFRRFLRCVHTRVQSTFRSISSRILELDWVSFRGTVFSPGEVVGGQTCS